MTEFGTEPPFESHTADDVARTQAQIASLLHRQDPGASPDQIAASAAAANRTYGGLFEAVDSGLVDHMHVSQTYPNGLSLELGKGDIE